MKYWQYNDEDLIEKKMYPLIPLQLFNLRKKLHSAKKKNDINTIKELSIVARNLAEKLANESKELFDQDEILGEDFHSMLLAIQNLIEYLNRNYIDDENLEEEVNIMTKRLYDPEVENIENHIPYIDKNNDEIDNSIINERYENVKKEDLTYDTEEDDSKDNEKEVITQVYFADSTKNDINYKKILQGFSYASESNPCDLTYNQAIELVKKLLPDDIKQVNSTVDEEVDKEYIYYESSKGNFRVGLSYGYEFNDENIEVVNKNKIVGIDYSKEVK